MSIADAHRFIQFLRRDPSVLTPAETIADVLAAARAAGFHFDEEDLRTAHRQDWTMRWTAVASRPAGAGGAEQGRVERPTP